MWRAEPGRATGGCWFVEFFALLRGAEFSWSRAPSSEGRACLSRGRITRPGFGWSARGVSGCLGWLLWFGFLVCGGRVCSVRAWPGGECLSAFSTTSCPVAAVFPRPLALLWGGGRVWGEGVHLVFRMTPLASLAACCSVVGLPWVGFVVHFGHSWLKSPRSLSLGSPVGEVCWWWCLVVVGCCVSVLVSAPPWRATPRSSVAPSAV